MGKAFHQQSYTLYNQVLSRIFPSLIGIPLLIRRIRLNWRDPLGVMFFFLIFIYFYGYISHAYGYGRVIFYIVLILQIIFAAFIAENKSSLNLKYFTVLLIVVSPFLLKHTVGVVKRYRPQLALSPIQIIGLN